MPGPFKTPSNLAKTDSKTHPKLLINKKIEPAPAAIQKSNPKPEIVNRPTRPIKKNKVAPSTDTIITVERSNKALAPPGTGDKPAVPAKSTRNKNKVKVETVKKGTSKEEGKKGAATKVKSGGKEDNTVVVVDLGTENKPVPEGLPVVPDSSDKAKERVTVVDNKSRKSRRITSRRRASRRKSIKKRWKNRVKRFFLGLWTTIRLQGTENYLFAFGSWEIMEKNSGRLSGVLDYLVYRIMDLFTGVVFTLYYVLSSNQLKWHSIAFWNEMVHLLYSAVYAFNVLTEDKFRHRVSAARNDEEYLSSLNPGQADSVLKVTKLPLTKLNQAVWLLGNITWNIKLTVVFVEFYLLSKTPDTVRFDLFFTLYNMVTPLLDIILTAYPIRYLHLIFTVAHLGLYAGFTLYLDFVHGIPGSKSIRWKSNPKATGNLFLSGIGVAAAIQLLLVLACKLRDLIITWCGDVPDAFEDEEKVNVFEMDSIEDVVDSGDFYANLGRETYVLDSDRVIQMGDGKGIELRDLTRDQVAKYLDAHPEENRVEFLAIYEAAQQEKVEVPESETSIDSEEERRIKFRLHKLKTRFQQSAKAFLDLYEQQKEKRRDEAIQNVKQSLLDGNAGEGLTMNPETVKAKTAEELMSQVMTPEMLKTKTEVIPDLLPSKANSDSEVGKKPKKVVGRGRPKKVDIPAEEQLIPADGIEQSGRDKKLDITTESVPNLPVSKNRKSRSRSQTQPSQPAPVQVPTLSKKPDDHAKDNTPGPGNSNAKPREKSIIRPLESKPAETDLASKLTNPSHKATTIPAPAADGDQAQNILNVVPKVKGATAHTHLPSAVGTGKEIEKSEQSVPLLPPNLPTKKTVIVDTRPSNEAIKKSYPRRTIIVHTRPSKPNVSTSVAKADVKPNNNNPKQNPPPAKPTKTILSGEQPSPPPNTTVTLVKVMHPINKDSPKELTPATPVEVPQKVDPTPPPPPLLKPEPNHSTPFAPPRKLLPAFSVAISRGRFLPQPLPFDLSDEHKAPAAEPPIVVEATPPPPPLRAETRSLGQPRKLPAFSAAVPRGRLLPPPKPFVFTFKYPDEQVQRRPSETPRQKLLKRLQRTATKPIWRW